MPNSESSDLEVGDTSGRFTRGASESIRERTFAMTVRGYDRGEVDAFVQEVYELVHELEGRQSRETVVQRALDQVGEETAGILQRAHETADEITSRSRAQAEGRLQRAERESDLLRRQADEFAEQVTSDTRLVWDERQRLLDDIRQLADDVLATADEASERLTLPQALGPLAPEDGEPGQDPGEPAEQPTAEVELDLLPGGASQEPVPGEEPVAGEEPVLGEEPVSDTPPEPDPPPGAFTDPAFEDDQSAPGPDESPRFASDDTVESDEFADTRVQDAVREPWEDPPRGPGTPPA